MIYTKSDKKTEIIEQHGHDQWKPDDARRKDIEKKLFDVFLEYSDWLAEETGEKLSSIAIDKRGIKSEISISFASSKDGRSIYWHLDSKGNLV